MTHILRKLRDDVAGVKRYSLNFLDRMEEDKEGCWVHTDQLDALIDAAIAAQPEPDELVAKLQRHAVYATGSANDAMLEAADLITSQQAEIRALEQHIKANCRICGGSGIASMSGGTGSFKQTIQPCLHGLTRKDTA